MSEEPPKKSSAAGTVIGVLIATILALVCGAGGGLYMAKMFDKADTATAGSNDAANTGKEKKSAKSAKDEKTGKTGKPDGQDMPEGDVKDYAPSGPKQRIVLAPITTNLLKPKGTWIRLEASVMPAKALPDDHTEVIAQIQEDLLGFLRTLKLSQIQGPSGFQHMREDLNDRVRIRSEGAFNKLLIHALLVE